MLYLNEKKNTGKIITSNRQKKPTKNYENNHFINDFFVDVGYVLKIEKHVSKKISNIILSVWKSILIISENN